MKRALVFAVCFFASAPVAVGAEGFLSNLSAEQKQRLGLDRLTAEQLAELGAAIENYRQTGEVTAAQKAAEVAVEEYKKQEEPGVISRALEVFKRKQDEERVERVTAVLQGQFSGWDGRTVFHLDNGQVWRQSASDVYRVKPREDVAVVIYRASSGYYRLRVLDDEGAWVTVKRVQ